MAQEMEVPRTAADYAKAPPASAAIAWALLILSALGLAGSLYLSIGLKLKACPLCFYQRTFIMGIAAILLIGLLTDRTKGSFLCLLSLPLAVSGLGVAAFHEYLVLSTKLECPAGVFQMGTAPAQSLAIFALVTLAALLGARQATVSAWPMFAAVVLGLLLAWGAIASAPPLPSVPPKAYDPEKQPLDTCRPPFVSS
jgi:disulfide bond formation protein DsbB